MSGRGIIPGGQINQGVPVTPRFSRKNSENVTFTHVPPLFFSERLKRGSMRTQATQTDVNKQAAAAAAAAAKQQAQQFLLQRVTETLVP